MERKIKLKILDCTIRDGGYYTDWDFSNEFVEKYCKYINDLPIDIVEVGYISLPKNGYKGKYFYLSKKILSKIRSLLPQKKNISDVES